ncbi:hypothetical protein KKB40_04640 [Patescibacteria group bacterium]|nr:hypothetical protein [Patescibacteria group bacterium]
MVFGRGNFSIICGIFKLSRNVDFVWNIAGGNFTFPDLVVIFSQRSKDMIENVENTYYFAAIVSSLFLIGIYVVVIKPMMNRKTKK